MKTEPTWSDRTRKGLGIGLVCFTVLFMGLLAFLVGRPLLRFLDDPARFRAWVDGMGIWGRLAFVGMMTLQVVIALIPGEPFEIAAGYGFGYVEGSVLCMAGIAVGSALIFLLTRTLGRKFAALFFPDKDLDSLKFLNTEKKRDLVTFLLLFLPGTPKDLLSYAAGLTEMKFWTWMLIVSVARIPSVVTSVICGGALNRQNYWVAAITFGVTALLSAAGLLIYRAVVKKKKQAEGGAL